MNMRSYICCNDDGSSKEVDALASELKIISEPNRLRILCILRSDEEHCVCELKEHMKDTSQSLLSHHLAELRDAQLVQSEKRGLKVYYSLTETGKKVTETVLSLLKKGYEI